MGEINIPRDQQAALAALDVDAIRRMIDDALRMEQPGDLYPRLSNCGPYVANRLHTFERDLARFRQAKAAKKREETYKDAHRAGYKLKDAIEAMRARLEQERKFAELFLIDDLITPPRPALRPQIASPDWTFDHRSDLSPADYRRIYRAVGEDWLWSSRLVLADEALSAIIHSPDVEIYQLRTPTGEEGLLELDFRKPGACELAFFGLSRGLIGGPAGRWLMNRAIERAWGRPIDRFWVHTCTFDHPAALEFYLRSGFAPYQRQIEVFADPRLSGVLRADAAPHVPLLPNRADEAAQLG